MVLDEGELAPGAGSAGDDLAGPARAPRSIRARPRWSRSARRAPPPSRRPRPGGRGEKSTSSPSIPRTAALTLLSSTSSNGASTSGSPSSKSSAKPMREGLGHRRERGRVLEAGRLVEDPRLDGAQIRMGPDVPPQVGVVVDRARVGHLLDPARVDLPAPVMRRHALAGEGPEDRRAAPTSSRCRGPPRRVSWTRGRAAGAGAGGCRRRRRSPCRGSRSRRGRACRRSAPARR